MKILRKLEFATVTLWLVSFKLEVILQILMDLRIRMSFLQIHIFSKVFKNTGPPVSSRSNLKHRIHLKHPSSFFLTVRFSKIVKKKGNVNRLKKRGKNTTFSKIV